MIVHCVLVCDWHVLGWAAYTAVCEHGLQLYTVALTAVWCLCCAWVGVWEACPSLVPRLQRAGAETEPVTDWV